MTSNWILARGLRRFAAVSLLAAVVTLALACEEDETSTPTQAPTQTATQAPTQTATATATQPPTETATATATVTATESPTQTATETETAEPTGTEPADPVSQFPADVQPLLEGLPANLIELLWKVRQAGPDELIHAGPGGEVLVGQERAWSDDWERITGWTFGSVPGAGGGAPPDFEVKVESGEPPWSLVAADEYAQALRWERAGLLQEIDLSLFPIDRFPPGALYNDYGVDAYDVSTLLAWNTEVFPLDGDHPQKVTDIFDTERFPGKRCLFGFPGFGQIEIALQADGVPPEQVYEVMATEEGLNRAFAKLDTIRDDIVFTESGAESIQFLIDGQCDLSFTWNGRVALRIKEEPDLPVAVTQNEAFLLAGPWVIPVGAEHYDAALSAMAYALQPQNQCDFMNEIAYGVVTDRSCLSDFALQWGPNAQEATLTHNAEYYIDNASTLSEAWEAWKTGG
jgi:putative spermidine/putrescine transport system substrate-binding protein